MSDPYRYAEVKLTRINDFDGDKQFLVTLNDEKIDLDALFGIIVTPDGFDVGKTVTLVCVRECHFKELP